MGKEVKGFKVKDFKKVNTSHYVEGSLFFTDKNIGMLVDGKIKTFTTSTPNLRNYVKKDEVTEIIKNIMKEGVKENE